MPANNKTGQPRVIRSQNVRPVSEETRGEVRRLHGEGFGRNEIARELGLAGSTVTLICKQFDPPLDFDRSMTDLALRAQMHDLAQGRAELARMFQLRSREALEALDAPILVGQFGGKDNEWNERVLDVPLTADARNLMTIAAIGAQRSLELERVESGSEDTAAGSLLDVMGSQLQAAAEVLRARGETSPTIEDTV